MREKIRWPAEWEPQAAVMLTWPRPGGDFADFTDIHEAFIRIANTLAKHAPLIVSVESDALGAQVREALAGCLPLAQVNTVACDDIWVRDHGPVGVLVGEEVQLNKFVFDGWGGKYPAEHDNELVLELATHGAFDTLGDVLTQPITLEGGGIETDGAGTLLATRSSVLDPRRNPGLSQEAMQHELANALGVSRFLWLENGDLAGDDTDGHIDTLVRFVAPNHLVYQSSASAELPNHQSLSLLAEELRALRQPDGTPYRLTALPHTQSAHNSDEGLLPTSYANFLFLNGALLVPQYGDPSDAEALSTLAKACPHFTVIGVDCRALVSQYGSLHCATMNIPAKPSTESSFS